MRTRSLIWLLCCDTASAYATRAAILKHPLIRASTPAMRAEDESLLPLAGGARRRRAAFDLDGDGEISSAPRGGGQPSELSLAVNRLAAKVCESRVPERPIIIHLDETELLDGVQLWRRWRATAWEVVWPRLVVFSLYTATTCALIHASAPEGAEWDFLTVPNSDTVPLVQKLQVRGASTAFHRASPSCNLPCNLSHAPCGGCRESIRRGST